MLQPHGEKINVGSRALRLKIAQKKTTPRMRGETMFGSVLRLTHIDYSRIVFTSRLDIQAQICYTASRFTGFA